METFEVPSWVVTFMPLVVLVITFLVARIPAFATIGKRNLGAVVACVLAVIVIALDPPVVAGEGVMEFMGAAVGLVLYWWKGAQMVYDLFTGQLAAPDTHAT